jgi:hypothetical protein|tara:strand:- start:12704 stop:13135 length:432 start_codon:yes stop_codon:yes gene_type:complete
MEIDLFGQIINRPEEENYEPENVNPFDLLKHISSKKYPDSLFGYNKYLTNLAMSQRAETTLYANEMNKYDDLSDQCCFDFYYYGLPKKNYFTKWAKMAKSEYTEMVKEYFKVSYKVAKQYEKILPNDELKIIKTWFDNRLGGR